MYLWRELVLHFRQSELEHRHFSANYVNFLGTFGFLVVNFHWISRWFSQYQELATVRQVAKNAWKLLPAYGTAHPKKCELSSQVIYTLQRDGSRVQINRGQQN